MKIIHSHRSALLFLLLSFSILSSCKEISKLLVAHHRHHTCNQVTVEPVQYAGPLILMNRLP